MVNKLKEPPQKKTALLGGLKRQKRLPKISSKNLVSDASIPEEYDLIEDQGRMVVQKDGSNVKFILRKFNVNEAKF
jgi:hypothetical protein